MSQVLKVSTETNSLTFSKNNEETFQQFKISGLPPLTLIKDDRQDVILSKEDTSDIKILTLGVVGIGAPSEGTSGGFPIPDMTLEILEDKIMYMGWLLYEGTWLVRKQDYAEYSFVDATGNTNMQYSTLGEAWENVATLSYI